MPPMRRTSFLLLTFLGLCAFLLCQQCQMPQGDGVLLDTKAKPFQQLSEYQFFTGNLNELAPNKGVLPYDLNSSLFTDYAEKARFVWMPKGVSAKFAADKAFEFPVGTVLIKNFFYFNDKRQPEKGRRIIETRLLVNREGGWDALSYVWNDEQTDATLSIAGDIKEVTWTNEAGLQTTFNYLVPNRNQCKGCHNLDGKLTPIGPKGRNLHKDFSYPDGSVANQHEKWASVGYLTGYDPAANHPKLAQWDRPESSSLHERAIAYLDINCGHCHNPQGPANTSGLNLTVDQPVNINLGIFKAPVSAGSGSGGRSYSIVPGHPEASILVYRMQTTDPGAMMPELGRVTVHREGVELIQAWIAGMDEKQLPDEGI
jgi:uncharacterized repeat protein (TIGR03806 family)